MAWNGSAGQSSVKSNERPRNSRRLSSRGLVVFAAIVVISALVAYIFLANDGDESEPTQPQKERSIPTSATAALVTTQVVEEVLDKNSLEWHKKYDSRYFVPSGAVRHADGRLYTKEGRRILEKLPNRTIDYRSGKKKVFEHQAERDIQRLLSIEPGAFFLGSGNFGPRFVESFKQSLVQPTLILGDDDDETKELKRQVNEVKANLKERMDAGEDIAQIMRETENELRQLSVYKQNLKRELSVLRKDDNVTEQDYADYVSAANKLLKERGMKELKSTKFIEAQLKYQRERYRAMKANSNSK